MRAVKWAAGLILTLLVALVLLVTVGSNSLRGPISRAVTEATGRELAIEGNLTPLWSWVHPRIRAEKVRFDNPQWAREDHMLRADAVEITVRLAPLLRGRVVLPEVRLERPEVFLELTADGRKNWLLDRDQKDQESRIHILGLTLDRGTLRYDEPGRDIAIDADLSTDADGVAFTLKGKWKGLALSGIGHGGSVLAVRDDASPYPLRAEARIGATTARVDGTVTNLAELAAMDMHIQLSGETMEELYSVLGIAFPDTSRYRTAGRIVREGTRVRYEKFTGKVGESDLAGTLEVDTAGKRPTMQGELTSRVLNLADLGPLVGTRKLRKTGVLPDAPFNAERWDSVDADVKIRAGAIKRPEQLPIENLATRIRMKDKVLSLDPLEFGVAGGRLAGTVRLEGNQDPIRADARLRVQKLKLAKLAPTIKENRASIGDVGGLVELAGRGNSVGQMLGAANGKIGLYVDSGQVSGYLMQLVALDLWGIARVKLRGDEPVAIRCAIGDFGVKNGVMQANAFVFDTEVVNIGGIGTVNLKTEEMDLTLVPEPKRGSIASLNSPLHVRGTFSKPEPAPEWGRITAKGAGALVMGLFNPLLAVIPLINEGPGKDSNCAQLIAQVTSSSRSAASGGTARRPPSRSAR